MTALAANETALELLGALHSAQGRFYAGGTAAPLHEILAPDVSWHVPGDNAIAGDYEGIDAVIEYFTRRRELASSTMRMHPLEFLYGEGDHVAILTDGTASIAGTEHRWRTVGLYRIRNERIAACWLLPLDPREFDRIWRRPDDAERG